MEFFSANMRCMNRIHGENYGGSYGCRIMVLLVLFMIEGMPVTRWSQFKETNRTNRRTGTQTAFTTKDMTDLQQISSTMALSRGVQGTQM